MWYSADKRAISIGDAPAVDWVTKTGFKRLFLLLTDGCHFVFGNRLISNIYGIRKSTIPPD
jgi:hypothetical protein